LHRYTKEGYEKPLRSHGQVHQGYICQKGYLFVVKNLQTKHRDRTSKTRKRNNPLRESNGEVCRKTHKHKYYLKQHMKTQASEKDE
jgi:hypothetical protein